MVNKTTARAIRTAILNGVAAGAHKGDLQDAVWAAIGGRFLTMDEAALCTRILRSTGYAAPDGFRRNALVTAKAA